MKREAEAIIIGAGVIVAATAFELCKRGDRTLNIDKMSAAGYGPLEQLCRSVGRSPLWSIQLGVPTRGPVRTPVDRHGAQLCQPDEILGGEQNPPLPVAALAFTQTIAGDSTSSRGVTYTIAAR
jgi:glycine/D-amino acid oxidase-like deaminating enzyme